MDEKQDYDSKQDSKSRWLKVLWVAIIVVALAMTPKILFWPTIAIVTTILGIYYASRRRDRR